MKTTTSQSPSSTTPAPSPCNAPPLILNGKFSPDRTVYQHGSTLAVVCDNGYKLSPGARPVRCNHGHWIGLLPNCEAGRQHLLQSFYF